MEVLKFKKIIEIAASVNDTTYAEVRSKSRKLAAIKARHMVMYELRQQGFILCVIRDMLDLNEHGTVINGITSVESQIKTNKEFKRDYEIFKDWINDI